MAKATDLTVGQLFPDVVVAFCSRIRKKICGTIRCKNLNTTPCILITNSDYLIQAASSYSVAERSFLVVTSNSGVPPGESSVAIFITAHLSTATLMKPLNMTIFAF